jgi:hypothetical protein
VDNFCCADVDTLQRVVFQTYGMECVYYWQQRAPTAIYLGWEPRLQPPRFAAVLGFWHEVVVPFDSGDEQSLSGLGAY